MHTRKIISVLRAIFESASLFVIALLVVLFALRQYTLCSFAQQHWYIGAILAFLYTTMTLSEDYINQRILKHGK